jgi:hypothetical protein
VTARRDPAAVSAGVTAGFRIEPDVGSGIGSRPATSESNTGSAPNAARWPVGGDLMTSPHAPRGRVRADLVYLGWQHLSSEADPGPAPTAPPASAEPDGVSEDWVAAQRREFGRLARPAMLAAAASVLVAVATAAIWLSGLMTGGAALVVAGAAAWSGLTSGRRLRRGRRALADRLEAEEARVAAFQEAQRRQVAVRQQEHARQVRAWKQRSIAFRRQPEWYPVTVPASVHRIDVAGGTLAGWSALLTMIAAPRLAAGGEVTVLDLTEGGVATDLLAVARRSGIAPLVWVLPADLPQLDLGALLPADVLADVLAQTVSAADGPAGLGATSLADPARDAALLGGVIRALSSDGNGNGGDGDVTARVSMPRLLAALRVLSQTGGPADHLKSGSLTQAQLGRLSQLAGRAAGQLTTERAWSIEARLRALASLGTSPTSRSASSLRVAWLDRRAAAVSNGVLAAYLVVALTAVLRQARPARRWQHTICLLGAERLPGGALDQLCDGAEISGAGLVLAYRSIPAHVRERLGRGDAAIGFMRLGNADDARLAAEQIGTEHRFVVSQLTDTVGMSLTDTIGASYTSTAGTSDSVTASDSLTRTTGRSHGRSQPGVLAPFADLTASASRDTNSSAAVCDSRSITAGISAGTSWGWSTSRAVGATDSAARTAQRSRESLVEQHELQQLPQSAVLLCYPAPGGRQVLLADANPAIMTLPTATLATPPLPAWLRQPESLLPSPPPPVPPTATAMAAAAAAAAARLTGSAYDRASAASTPSARM